MAKQKFNFGAVKETNSIHNDKEPLAVEEINQKLEEPQREQKKDSFEVRLIPRNKIRSNNKNKYSLSDINKLKKSILHFGLQQNLVAVYSIEEDMYITEAGHRRTQALDELINEYADFDINSDDEDYQLYLKNVSFYERGYPVKVSGILQDGITYDAEEVEIHDIPDAVLDSEIRLYVTNTEVRNESVAEKARAIQRLGHLYDEKNRRLKRNDKINVNKTIGSELGVTDRHVADIRVTEKLIPQLQELFESNGITLKEASTYAKLSTEDQETIVRIVKSGEKVSKAEIEQMKKERDRIEEEKNLFKAKLKEKEKELESLRTIAAGAADDSQSSDEEKKQLTIQVTALEAEITSLRKQHKTSLKADLPSEEKLLIIYDINLKEQINRTTKEMKGLLDLYDKYSKQIESVNNDTLKNLKVMSTDEILTNLVKIRDLINDQLE